MNSTRAQLQGDRPVESRTNASSATPATVSDRFWRLVQTGEPAACWPWAGAMRGRYGRLDVDGTSVPAHRFALEAQLGRPIRSGYEAAHHCDNPPCCNPAHLYEATPKANARDAVLRGRAPQRTPRFPDTPWGRLRAQTGWSLRELAVRSGVNPADLSRLERGFGPTPDQARRLLAAFDEAGVRL